MSRSMTKKDWARYIRQCARPSPRKTEWEIWLKGRHFKSEKIIVIPGRHKTAAEARAAYFKMTGRKRLPAHGYLTHWGWAEG